MLLIDFSEPKTVFTLKTTPCPPDGLIHLTLNEGSQSEAAKCSPSASRNITRSLLKVTLTKPAVSGIYLAVVSNSSPVTPLHHLVY